MVSDSVTVTAIVSTLQVSATGTPNSGTVPLTVSFKTTVSGGLSPYTYSWSFGDGSTSSLANPSHTYTSSGTYTAQVIVRDSSSPQQMVSDSVTVTVQFSVTFTFTKPDGSTLANTMIYYGASKGQETNVLGTTDSSGRLTSTNSAFADQTLYFKSSDGRYTGSTSVSSSGGSTSVSLTEVPGFPTILLALLVLLVGIGGGIVIMWKKVLSKPKSARHHPIRKRKSSNTRTRLSANKGGRADKGGPRQLVAERRG